MKTVGYKDKIQEGVKTNINAHTPKADGTIHNLFQDGVKSLSDHNADLEEVDSDHNEEKQQ